MAEHAGDGPILGYCTNVHPETSAAAGGRGGGARIESVQAGLLKHACAVKDRISPGGPLPVGLWLPAKAATQLIGDPARFEGFRDFLSTHGLQPFTFNAFPWGDFHGSVVKHRVYRLDWSEFERLEYTVAIAAIAADLCPPGAEVSISTLPIAWGKHRGGPEGAPCDLAAAAMSLRSLARHLARVEADSGRLIHVDLEPEPGCFLDTAPDVVGFFEQHLLPRGQEEMVRRHIRVCHDVCHAAVMHEGQEAALQTYAGAGIAVGKVQISAAVGADLDRHPQEDRPRALDALAAFAEGRYLHQTVVALAEAAERLFFEDLPEALAAAGQNPALLSGRWRTHFHVPIHLGRLGLLHTTADEIPAAVEAARRLHGVRHFEVETYAWNVLPEAHRAATLAEELTQELRHARAILDRTERP